MSSDSYHKLNWTINSYFYVEGAIGKLRVIILKRVQKDDFIVKVDFWGFKWKRILNLEHPYQENVKFKFIISSCWDHFKRYWQFEL